LARCGRGQLQAGQLATLGLLVRVAFWLYGGLA
jgi:hypothetical protein